MSAGDDRIRSAAGEPGAETAAAFVRPIVGDAVMEIGGLGTFSLVFATRRRKLYGFDLTLAAWSPTGS